MTLLPPEVLELERIHALEPLAPETSTETLLRWSEDDLFRARMENVYLRGLIDEGEKARKALWFSRNHWRLAAAVAVGFAVIAVVCR